MTRPYYSAVGRLSRDQFAAVQRAASRRAAPKASALPQHHRVPRRP